MSTPSITLYQYSPSNIWENLPTFDPLCLKIHVCFQNPIPNFIYIIYSSLTHLFLSYRPSLNFLEFHLMSFNVVILMNLLMVDLKMFNSFKSLLISLYIYRYSPLYQN